MTKHVFLISGIDTDVGKTVATAQYAKELTLSGINVTTQKIVQTGCTGIAQDILTHRRLQSIPLSEHDRNGTTAPYVFPYPCSPHMAAEREHTQIDPKRIKQATDILLQHYDTVLLEGAGGLMVPLTRNQTILDYAAEHRYPVILVTSGKLGSINHTLLSLNALAARKLPVHRIIYNRYPIYDPAINTETERFLQHYTTQHFPQTEWRTLDKMTMPV
ncbi:MAG: dethiobiotin synthase [Neisseria sp.]|uniref:dethiobiotin synthase n=1 Tax=Neisseria sp. TaxID=192066 RepID=UPI0026DBE0EE|nr:dethiobiotin synthase [Neisseria sp.]MDO4641059.1 dethiobiotin synthase [Neisseria sp.]